MSYLHTSSDWGGIKHRVPQGSILGPLPFLLQINDLPTVINNRSKPILFADDTSIIISNPNPINFKKDIINIFEQMNVWFIGNFFIIKFR
jgi:hypothetical protein